MNFVSNRGYAAARRVDPFVADATDGSLRRADPRRLPAARCAGTDRSENPGLREDPAPTNVVRALQPAARAAVPGRGSTRSRMRSVSFESSHMLDEDPLHDADDLLDIDFDEDAGDRALRQLCKPVDLRAAAHIDDEA